MGSVFYDVQIFVRLAIFKEIDQIRFELYVEWGSYLNLYGKRTN
jgi:hypothetical protein